MENTENLVTEVTENVEQTTEQTPKLFTQDEVNDMMGKGKARARAKIEKEYQRNYGELIDVLKAGMGKEDIGEITADLRAFYGKKNIPMPEKQKYSERDITTLAKSDADEIIRGGFDEVLEEADRLKEIGVENMTARDKALFMALTDHIKNTEASRELSKIGVTEDVYGSKEFKDFASKFNPNTPITDVYNIYQKTLPKKDIKPMGSMKNSTSTDSGVKDFYTRDEALQFTKKDFDKNPALFKAVSESMTKW